ncbi:pathogenesis-related thaumatin-like protein 3.5 isoform X2 [Nicotiana tabacum]|uniref:Pathogenesis-related protein 5-like isoform X1 n=2 Tax=Nicotiana TaxID=4085 RepID=A0A1S4DPU0_TOBAC|nr:PREDICTED: pathogenesis-related protein 5-like isoform X1 [Nicotiana sylvestris]XP_016515435.1 PREDICTED: pathogenesis-related protein 5-like isoform X1 [Nicotiana tabacum]
MKILMAISSALMIHSVIVLIFCEGILGATFTFVNKCDKTVWPGILGTPKLDSTGFELTKGSSRSFQAPTGWSGRFWGRTGCNFDDSGSGSCATADCGSGQMECNGGGATPPATLAEFTLGSGSQDFYDVSLVDGYNLPMMVEVSGGSGPCASTGCNVDLNQKCPTELMVDGGGACRSACDAFRTPQYCCEGAYASPATCSPSVYSQMFKSACPKSYSYAYDDATSTFTCSNANYIITFCPSSLPSKKSSKSDGSTDGSGSESGSGSFPGTESGTGSETGAGSGSLPGSESGAGSGSMGQAMLADGSWLASLATGSSASNQPSRVIQFIPLIVAFVLFIGSLLKL